ncbi:hypothetical protein EBR43_04595, partial [bacterium]|nr:hypothetical protein [bacterium]
KQPEQCSKKDLALLEHSSIKISLALIAKDAADPILPKNVYTDNVSHFIATCLVKNIRSQFKEVEDFLAKETSIHSMKDLDVNAKKKIDALYTALHSSLDNLELPHNYIDSNLIALKVIEQLELQSFPKSHIIIQLLDSIEKALYQLFLTLTCDNKKDKKIILFSTQHSLNTALGVKVKQQLRSQTAQ